jgi:8-oxo-dGTP pyrophosphatase MutT (NUDIX family)
MPKRDSGKPKKQVAALPVATAEDGSLRVLVITSRETRRFIVPKGWPIKGVKDHRAAEIEAREEAGLIGRAHKKPIGSYLAWKRPAV